MKALYFIIIALALVSCIKDKPQEPQKTVANIAYDDKVLVINEGNFGWGVGYITLYDPISGAVIEKYDQQQNSGNTLGNVCQSMTKYNNNYYIVINNSGKIVISNTTDFTQKGTITGFNSPRYLLPITYSKAYVSDLYANSIQIVDLNTNAISGNITCMAGTEEMALIYNKAFVTCTNSNYCYIINTTTDAITDSVYVGKSASSLIIDKYSKVWVLASGSSTSSQVAMLTKINPISLQIEQTYSFNSNESPFRLCCNKTRDTLYFLNKGVFQMSILSSNLPNNELIPQGSKNYYAISINPKDYSIYVADAIDYVQRSKVEIYKPNGTYITNFTAGIITNGFMFE